MTELTVFVAPNIETIRNIADNATKVNEQEKFDEIKTAIEGAAVTGNFEVVFKEDMTEEDKIIYPQILKNSGYGVCIGKYNGTNKVCTLVFWCEKDRNGREKWIEVADKNESGQPILNPTSEQRTIQKNSQYVEA